MLKVAVSPCPNDTISFWPFFEGVFSPNFPLSVDFFELDRLNHLLESGLHKSSAESYDIIKISCSMQDKIASSSWQILPVGGAYSYSNGPKLICHKKAKNRPLEDLDLVIPSIHSSAYRIFSALFSKHKNSLHHPQFRPPVVLPYFQILDAISHNVDLCGLIIHESHLCLDPSLHCLRADLGEIWRKQKQCPIPLGMQVARKELPEELVEDYCRYWKQATVFALLHCDQALGFIRTKSQESSEKVIYRYLEDFVNLDSFTRGAQAEKALQLLCTRFDHCDGPLCRSFS